MDNKEFGKQLEDRTKRFAIKIIQLSAKIENTQESRIVKNQITKSGTSIGANYREANRARSKADFLNKIKICEGEASETKYWLEIIAEMNWCNEDLIKESMLECDELLAIFTSIGRKGRSELK